ncbi:MAG: CinA family protein [Treponema sp.]|nr:CinA family protein [Treponema sp.]
MNRIWKTETEEYSTGVELIRFLKQRSLRIAAAESCTAGLAAALLADVPGASGVFWGAFVCYTAGAKTSMLGIESAVLEKYGLVSAECAGAMALGALKKSGVDAAFSITGLAGPGGDGSQTPVGTVWIAGALKGKVDAVKYHFTGPRNELRQKAARTALEQILKKLKQEYR